MLIKVPTSEPLQAHFNNNIAALIAPTSVYLRKVYVSTRILSICLAGSARNAGILKRSLPQNSSCCETVASRDGMHGTMRWICVEVSSRHFFPQASRLQIRQKSALPSSSPNSIDSRRRGDKSVVWHGMAS